MGTKMVFRYDEAAPLLGYKNYNAVKVAVCKGKLQNWRRNDGTRSAFIHRDEILRKLGQIMSPEEAIKKIDAA